MKAVRSDKDSGLATWRSDLLLQYTLAAPRSHTPKHVAHPGKMLFQSSTTC